MAQVTNWIEHLTTDTDGGEVGTQVAGAIIQELELKES